MFQYCFIDLDDTIFDTYLFKRDIFDIFAKCGVTKEDYEKSYLQAVFGPVEGYFEYTYKKHADILRDMGHQIPDETIEKLEQLLRRDYNDHEAKPFLVDLKKISSNLILLTAGEKKLQDQKICSTHLAKYFDEVIVIDGGKTQKILDVAGSARKILFVNDNLKENVKIKSDLPYVLVVAKKHKDMWRGDDYSKYDLPVFDSLNEIKDYAAKFI